MARNFGIARSTISGRAKREKWLPHGSLKCKVAKEAVDEAKETIKDSYKRINKEHSDSYQLARSLAIEMLKEIRDEKVKGNEIVKMAYILQAIINSLDKATASQRDVLGFDKITPEYEGDKLEGLFKSFDEIRKKRGLIKNCIDDMKGGED